MPVTHKILGLDLVSANMNKTFVIAVYTIAALLVFANNELEWALEFPRIWNGAGG